MIPEHNKSHGGLLGNLKLKFCLQYEGKVWYRSWSWIGPHILRLVCAVAMRLLFAKPNQVRVLTRFVKIVTWICFYTDLLLYVFLALCLSKSSWSVTKISKHLFWTKGVDWVKALDAYCPFCLWQYFAVHSADLLRSNCCFQFYVQGVFNCSSLFSTPKLKRFCIQPEQCIFFNKNNQCKKAPHWLSIFLFWFWKLGGTVKRPTQYLKFLFQWLMVVGAFVVSW